MTQPPQPPLTRAEEAQIAELCQRFGDPSTLQPGETLEWEFDFPAYLLQHVQFRAERDLGVVLTWKVAKPRYWTYQAKRKIRFRCKGRWSKAS